MPTIGVLTTSYPHEGDRVAGAFVRGMLRALVELGHEAEVLAPAPARSTRALDDPGVRVRWIPYAPPALRRTFYGAGVPDNVRRDPRAWPGLGTFPLAMAAEARRAAPGWDAVLSHWALPSAIVGGLVRGDRPHLAVLHSADVHLLRRMPGRSRWVGSVARSASELLFASNALRRDTLSWLPPVDRANLARRCHACAMGIDDPPPTDDRPALRARWRLQGPTLLALTRLVPIKGIRHAIDALDGVDAELLVVGDGPERGALEERARRRGARARFLGVRTGIEKAELLRAADAFVAPSRELASGRTEGTPTALLEAALAGLPIVASPTGGIAEVFQHESSALLVPPVALGRAVRRLLGDRRLATRLARRARSVAETYRWPELAPRIEELLFRR